MFLLSPPGLNHTATFNATAAVMMFNEESILDPTAVFLLSFRCGFRPDGLVITDTTTDVGEAPYNPIYSEMYIQPGIPFYIYISVYPTCMRKYV